MALDRLGGAQEPHTPSHTTTQRVRCSAPRPPPPACGPSSPRWRSTASFRGTAVAAWPPAWGSTSPLPLRAALPRRPAPAPPPPSVPPVAVAACLQRVASRDWAGRRGCLARAAGQASSTQRRHTHLGARHVGSAAVRTAPPGAPGSSPAPGSRAKPGSRPAARPQLQAWHRCLSSHLLLLRPRPAPATVIRRLGSRGGRRQHGGAQPPAGEAVRAATGAAAALGAQRLNAETLGSALEGQESRGAPGARRRPQRAQRCGTLGELPQC